MRIAKEKWAKAEQSLRKSLRKDTVKAEAKYIYAQWYFSKNNPDFDIDSAYHYVQASMNDYRQGDERLRERLQRFPLDSTLIQHLRTQIDSAAFERAKNINTEQSYQDFIDRFKLARQIENAIELRDEVSFLDALRVNTYQRFDEYLAKYPDSHRAVEARSRYEKLLFEEKTRDGKLKSYISFYQSFPKSPFRAFALKQIFEISTASGNIRDYLNFINKYGHDNEFSKKAKDIAFHIAVQENDPIPAQILSDSLLQVIKLEAGYWIPFLKNGKFGFMDQEGNEMIQPKFSQVADAYLCGNVMDDFLITSEGVVSRTGVVLIGGAIQNTDDLGYGILMVEMDGCIKIVHKSGFLLFEDCILDAKVIANRFVAIQKGDEKWQLIGFNGKEILKDAFEAIESVESIITLRQKGKWMLNTIDHAATMADGNQLKTELVADEVRKLGTEKVLVKNGSLEGVINSKLEFIIPLDRQALTQTSFGFTKRYLNKVTTVGVSDEIDKEEFSDIIPYSQWLGLYKPGDIRLYQLKTSKVIERNLDSLWFTNRLAIALKGDSLKVHFASGRKMLFQANTRVTFIKSPDSVRFFTIVEQNKQQVFEVDSGMRKFAIECDRLEDLGHDIFLVEKKGKAGLMGIDGKLIVPVEYDAIVKTHDQFVSLLKNKKFGIYDLKNRILIKPTFDRNLKFYNESTLVAYKDGYYGFIGVDALPISAFEFEEVQFWNDSAAMVKKNFRWMVYDIYTKRVLHAQIKDYRLIKDTQDEKIAIIHVENEYGVLSSVKGIIIPATFSDVINLGTSESPFYLTEKHVEEADIFVVIYYNEDGKLVRREIYEADEYDLIYCQ